MNNVTLKSQVKYGQAAVGAPFSKHVLTRESLRWVTCAAGLQQVTDSVVCITMLQKITFQSLEMNDAVKIFASINKNKQTSRAARIMVVSCERSPHSARKVRVRAWMKMGEMKLWQFPWGRLVPDPASTSGVPLASLDLWSCKTALDQKISPQKLHLPIDLWKYFHNCVIRLHKTSHQKTVSACLVYSYSTRCH